MVGVTEAGLKTRSHIRQAAVVVALLLAVVPAPRPQAAAALATAPLVQEVAVVGMTVSDMDRSVAFFTDVLTFEKLSDVELADGEHERLLGLFGVRLRVVRLRLGDEQIELTEFLAPRGRPVPSDSRSNDRWFQHVAIIVSDMDAAYTRLRQHKVERNGTSRASGSSSASTIQLSWWATPTPACRSTVARSAFVSQAKAPTTDRSRSVSIVCSAHGSASPG